MSQFMDVLIVVGWGIIAASYNGFFNMLAAKVFSAHNNSFAAGFVVACLVALSSSIVAVVFFFFNVESPYAYLAFMMIVNVLIYAIIFNTTFFTGLFIQILSAILAGLTTVAIVLTLVVVIGMDNVKAQMNVLQLELLEYQHNVEQSMLERRAQLNE